MSCVHCPIQLALSVHKHALLHSNMFSLSTHTHDQTHAVSTSNIHNSSELHMHILSGFLCCGSRACAADARR